MTGKFPANRASPQFELILDTNTRLKEFVRTKLAINHTREMVIELNNKMDRIEDMLSHLLLLDQDGSADRYITKE